MINLFTPSIYALEKPETPKVIMVIINRVNFDDLQRMPRVKALMDEGAVTLMNTRASGKNSEFKSYATLGAGIRAEASHSTALFYPLDKNTKAIYERRMEGGVAEKGIINYNIHSLLQQNLRGEYGAMPGALGEMLTQQGYKTIILGNSDTEDYLSRAAGFIPMDSRGYIHGGQVDGDLIQKDINSPFGMKTNYDKLLEAFIGAYNEGNFFVIETGDINRLESYRTNVTNSMYIEHKNNALDNIDGFIDKLLQHIEGDPTVLMLVTPYPSDDAAARGERLTPVVIYEEGAPGGLLWSGTTRRMGIIGNVDIAPTVLGYFDIEPIGMIGRGVTTVAADDGISYIQYLNRRVVNTSLQRYRILYSFAVYQMLASVAALLTIVFRKRIPAKWYNPVAFCLLGTIVAPFTLLILPLLGVLTITLNYIFLIIITGILIIVLYYLGRKEPLNIILYASLLVSAGLILDIGLGQNLIKNSILGYDPIIGARYYGIGNEYMGVLIGAVLIFTTTLLDRYNMNKYFVILFYLLTTIVIAFPTMGANVGGTITAVFAFLFTSIRLLQKKINIKRLIYILIGVISVVVVMAVIDLFFMENHSHLASAIQQIVDNGPIVIYQIITRKIAMNIRVMGVTVWSRVLLMTIAIVGILFYRPAGIIKKITSTYPNMTIGWGGIIVACGVSFAVNDSGVVSAATTIIFLSTTILYLIMDSFYRQKRCKGE